MNVLAKILHVSKRGDAIIRGCVIFTGKRVYILFYQLQVVWHADFQWRPWLLFQKLYAACCTWDRWQSFHFPMFPDILNRTCDCMAAILAPCILRNKLDTLWCQPFYWFVLLKGSKSWHLWVQSTPFNVNTGKVNTPSHSNTSPGQKVKENWRFQTRFKQNVSIFSLPIKRCWSMLKANLFLIRIFKTESS